MELLQHLVEFVPRLVPGVTSCVLSAEVGDSAQLVFASDPVSGSLSSVGDSPSRSVLRRKVAIQIDDLSLERRWPAFVVRARRFHLDSGFVAPLLIKGEVIGTLEFYATRAHAFDDALRPVLEDLTRLAAVGLTTEMARREHTAMAVNLRQALSSRASIDHAIGILMAQTGCAPQQAFTMLREASQRRNVRLAVIAEETVRNARSAVEDRSPTDKIV